MNTTTLVHARSSSASLWSCTWPAAAAVSTKRTNQRAPHSPGGQRSRSRSTLLVGVRDATIAHPPSRRPPPANERRNAAGAPESLSEYMQKIRHLSANARPLSKNEAVETLETRDPAIAAELLLVSSEPTAERTANLAERYRERGVLDAAYRNFNRAIALNPRDAAAYEGLARVWRDWGLPELALGDAHRAVYYAPQSASARNTYGTIMQALGQLRGCAGGLRAGEPAGAAGGLCRQQSVLPGVSRRADRFSDRDMPEGARTRPDNDRRAQQPGARVRGGRAYRSGARGVRRRRRSRQRALQHRHRLSRRRRSQQRAGRVRRGEQGTRDVSSGARARAADPRADVPRPTDRSASMAPPTQPSARTALLNSRTMITIAEFTESRSVPGAAADARGVGAAPSTSSCS